MVAVGAKDKYERWKPEGFEKHKTVSEVCRIIKRDRRQLIVLEGKGYIPKPIRVKAGRLQVRLYSPDEVAKIVAYFKDIKPGRKGGSE